MGFGGYGIWDFPLRGSHCYQEEAGGSYGRADSHEDFGESGMVPPQPAAGQGLREQIAMRILGIRDGSPVRAQQGQPCCHPSEHSWDCWGWNHWLVKNPGRGAWKCPFGMAAPGDTFHPPRGGDGLKGPSQLRTFCGAMSAQGRTAGNHIPGEGQTSSCGNEQGEPWLLCSLLSHSMGILSSSHMGLLLP